MNPDIRYSMLIQWSDEDQVYICSLPEFGPYCKTHGSTYEEAARMGQEVLEMLVETVRPGEVLPAPQKFQDELAGKLPSRAPKAPTTNGKKTSSVHAGKTTSPKPRKPSKVKSHASA